MRKILSVAFCLILVISFIGCGQGSVTNLPGKAAIRGQITSITQNTENKTAVILVEGQKESDTEYDKASITINSSTKILKGGSKDLLPITDLKKGMKVEAYWDGPVRESYPVQIGANIIRILQ